jgi:hypothetical protein
MKSEMRNQREGYSDHRHRHVSPQSDDLPCDCRQVFLNHRLRPSLSSPSPSSPSSHPFSNFHFSFPFPTYQDKLKSGDLILYSGFGAIPSLSRLIYDCPYSSMGSSLSFSFSLSFSLSPPPLSLSLSVSFANPLPLTSGIVVKLPNKYTEEDELYVLEYTRNHDKMSDAFYEDIRTG